MQLKMSEKTTALLKTIGVVVLAILALYLIDRYVLRTAAQRASAEEHFGQGSGVPTGRDAMPDAGMPLDGKVPASSEAEKVGPPTPADLMPPSAEEAAPGMEAFNGSPEENGVSPGGCYPRDRLTPEELLPQDNASSMWAQVHPKGQGSLQDKDFLQTGYHVGIDTVGQTLRNPNLQIRSEPPNPQVKVGPWNQSTIEPDTNRRSFEIGQC